MAGFHYYLSSQGECVKQASIMSLGCVLNSPGLTKIP